MFLSFEPAKDKTYNQTCAPGKDLDQPLHPPCLIIVLAVRMKKAWVLRYSLCAQRILIRLGECSGWSESSLGACGFVAGSFFFFFFFLNTCNLFDDILVRFLTYIWESADEVYWLEKNDHFYNDKRKISDSRNVSKWHGCPRLKKT